MTTPIYQNITADYSYRITVRRQIIVTYQLITTAFSISFSFIGIFSGASIVCQAERLKSFRSIA